MRLALLPLALIGLASVASAQVTMTPADRPGGGPGVAPRTPGHPMLMRCAEEFLPLVQSANEDHTKLQVAAPRRVEGRTSGCDAVKVSGWEASFDGSAYSSLASLPAAGVVPNADGALTVTIGPKVLYLRPVLELATSRYPGHVIQLASNERKDEPPVLITPTAPGAKPVSAK